MFWSAPVVLMLPISLVPVALRLLVLKRFGTLRSTSGQSGAGRLGGERQTGRWRGPVAGASGSIGTMARRPAHGLAC